MKRFTSVAALVAMLALGSASVASAATSSRPCTLGDAQANFEAPFEHLFQSLGICHYRLFFDGATFTFCEGDFILGGVVNTLEHKTDGLTRSETIDQIERFGQRVWLDGVEQSLLHTTVKDGMHPLFGHVVYQHYAFITQLPPGQYVSYFEGSTDGVVDFTATVNLDVLPRTDASCTATLPPGRR